MKKLLFTIQIVGILAIIPVLAFAYLNDNTTTQATQETQEMAKEKNNLIDAAQMIRMVKSF